MRQSGAHYGRKSRQGTLAKSELASQGVPGSMGIVHAGDVLLMTHYDARTGGKHLRAGTPDGSASLVQQLCSYHSVVERSLLSDNFSF